MANIRSAVRGIGTAAAFIAFGEGNKEASDPASSPTARRMHAVNELQRIRAPVALLTRGVSHA
jgi:hypothetical protein